MDFSYVRFIKIDSMEQKNCRMNEWMLMRLCIRMFFESIFICECKTGRSQLMWSIRTVSGQEDFFFSSYWSHVSNSMCEWMNWANTWCSFGRIKNKKKKYEWTKIRRSIQFRHSYFFSYAHIPFFLLLLTPFAHDAWIRCWLHNSEFSVLVWFFQQIFFPWKWMGLGRFSYFFFLQRQ